MLSGMEHNLKQYISKYHNPDLTRRDVMRVLEQYKGLRFKLEPYCFTNGLVKNLVNLSGTIPVRVAGIIYNIPICIWIMETHPNHAPICYVKPTNDMEIKMSVYVDHNGKIYFPYLHEWSPTGSDLLGLIQVMIVTFGEHPPVFSKPRTENSTPYPQQVYMPMPGVSAGQHTPYPPYPVMQHRMAYPPGYPQQQPRMMGHDPAITSGGSGTITEEHIRASLLSAVEHKLGRRLEEQFAQSKAELEILQQSAEELNQGRTKLDSIFEKLNREKAELERDIAVLKEKDAELEKSIAEHKGKEEIDVDEAVLTTAPLYKQILNAYAEEAATEDAIYYMGEALRRGVIDLDVFLKQVRSLSTKQFTLRALMQKCRQKAGLAG